MRIYLTKQIQTGPTKIGPLIYTLCFMPLWRLNTQISKETGKRNVNTVENHTRSIKLILAKLKKFDTFIDNPVLGELLIITGKS